MERRYDIDWVRVIAIGLLIIYHTAISFQPWGSMLAFITNKEPWAGLWFPMTLMNIWRIPLLFFVSGMGVYFAMRSRAPLQLIGERGRRIMVPYVFGAFFIVPVQIGIWRYYNGMQLRYVFDPAHLWFLGNIMAYVIIWVGAFYYINKNGDLVRRIFTTPVGILLAVAALVGEAVILKPYPYELYAMTWHGFILGLIAFFFGYCIAFTGKPFWEMITKWWWLIIIAVATLATFRLTGRSQVWLIPVESVGWILLVLIGGYRFLNKPGKALSYLSEAAYPVYVLHMIFQNLGGSLIFPLEIAVPVKYVLLVGFTLGGCMLVYEFIVRRTMVTRFLFGLKATKPVQP